MKKTISAAVAASILALGISSQLTYANNYSAPTKTNRVTTPKVFIDNESISKKTDAPILKNGRYLVPVKTLAEYLHDSKLTYDAKTHKSRLVYKSKNLVLGNNSHLVYVNGKKVNIDEPAQIINGRFYVPLRVVSEGIGAKVKYDASKKEVYIRIYKELPTKYFYTDEKGNINTANSNKDAANKVAEGTDVGKEVITSESYYDLTTKTTHVTNTHSGKYMIGEKEKIVSLQTEKNYNFNGDTIKDRTFRVHVYNQEDLELEYFFTGNLLGHNTEEETLAYSGYEVLKDLGYIVEK